MRISRELMCDKLRIAIGTRTHAHIADLVSESTERKAHGSHVSEALNPIPKDPRKYDRLRLDMANVLLGGEWVMPRLFERKTKREQ